MQLRLIGSFILILSLFLSCSNTETKKSSLDVDPIQKQAYKFSLGQWSFHKDLFDGKMNTFDFIKECKRLGFDGVDFVNQFFIDKAEDKTFLDSIKLALNEQELEATMIMIDLEGDIGNPDQKERKQAVENHKKWVDAAQYIDCKVVRANAFGIGTSEEVMEACISSIKDLAAYAKTKDVLLLIENHGGYSSDANWLVALMDEFKGQNVALLPDFDNWCIEREGGARWSAPCINEYDRYQGMKQLLPYAKSLSIKSFGFDKDGNEIKTDYKKMFNLVKESGFNDYMGIEFEGDGMTPEEGIKKTLALVQSIIE